MCVCVCARFVLVIMSFVFVADSSMSTRMADDSFLKQCFANSLWTSPLGALVASGLVAGRDWSEAIWEPLPLKPQIALCPTSRCARALPWIENHRKYGEEHFSKSMFCVLVKGLWSQGWGLLSTLRFNVWE